MCQDINLSSVPSVGHKTGSSFHHGLDGLDGLDGLGPMGIE